MYDYLKVNLRSMSLEVVSSFLDDLYEHQESLAWSPDHGSDTTVVSGREEAVFSLSESSDPSFLVDRAILSLPRRWLKALENLSET